MELPETNRVALWHGPGMPLELTTMPIADPGENGLILRVRSAVFGAALVRAVRVGHPKMQPSAVLGSLVAGDVVSAGANVAFQPGTPVIVDPHPPCNQCENCRNQVKALCTAKIKIDPGGLAEYVKIPGELVPHIQVIPSGVPYRYAVYTEIIACVAESIHESALNSTDTVLIIGCGPIALLHIQLARLNGVKKVICLYNHTEREAVITKMGAIPLDVRKGHEYIQKAVRELCGKPGADVVFEAVGRVEALQLAITTVCPGGKVILFGGYAPNTQVLLDPNRLHYNGIHLIGCYHYRPGMFEYALTLLAEGKIQLADILTHTVSFDRIIEAPTIAGSADCIALIVEHQD